jgi:hypothetical protein
MITVICVKINTDFKHHLQIFSKGNKLEIGSKYLAKISNGGYVIYDLNEKYVGLYHFDQFITLRDYNLNKLLE